MKLASLSLVPLASSLFLLLSSSSLSSANTRRLGSRSLFSPKNTEKASSDSKAAWVFDHIPYPVNEQDFRKLSASKWIGNQNGDRESIDVRVLLRTGQEFPNGGVFGGIMDRNGRPVYRNATTDLRIYGVSPDFSSFHDGPKPNQYWMLTHIETPGPGQVYKTLIQQDPETGTLRPLTTEHVDFSSLSGVWTPCTGSQTEWGNHLGSEEYEPDARAFLEANDTSMDKYVTNYLKYFGVYENNVTKSNAEAVFNPYNYGHPWEAGVEKDGKTTVEKRLAMGRLAFEMYRCMPDKKTCYGGDDGDNTMLIKFVADEPEELSKGTIYGAKFLQKDDAKEGELGPSLSISWVKLGHAADWEIQKYLDQKITFNDIFETAEWSEAAGCPEGFLSANTLSIAVVECLKVEKGMEKAAAFLETRRYAGMKRVTTEFNKMEGITYSKSMKKLFVSIANVRYGMEDKAAKGKATDKYDRGTDNDIRLPWNPCGCVFAFDFDEKYSLTGGAPYICGKPKVYGPASTYGRARGGFSNKCDVENIANPDNIHYVEEAKTLLIYEDTDSHTSNSLWAYRTDKKELTRILTSVYTSEVSGAWYHTVGDYGYIFVAVQHPYFDDQGFNPPESESQKELRYCQAGVEGNVKEYVAGSDDHRGYVAYIGPLKDTAVFRD